MVTLVVGSNPYRRKNRFKIPHFIVINAVENRQDSNKYRNYYSNLFDDAELVCTIWNRISRNQLNLEEAV